MRNSYIGLCPILLTLAAPIYVCFIYLQVLFPLYMFYFFFSPMFFIVKTNFIFVLHLKSQVKEDLKCLMKKLLILDGMCIWLLEAIYFYDEELMENYLLLGINVLIFNPDDNLQTHWCWMACELNLMVVRELKFELQVLVIREHAFVY